MSKLNYKGYEIIATPHQLAKNNRWTLNIHIERHHSKGVTDKSFSAADTYETKEEAINHCFNFGKQIIEGQIEGCSVDDL